MNESQFTRNFRKKLQDALKTDLFMFKVNPGNSGYMMPGIPDLIGSYKGKFFGIEVKYVRKMPTRDNSKMLTKSFTNAQKLVLTAINQSGGAALLLIRIENITLMIPYQFIHLFIEGITKKDFVEFVDTNKQFVVKNNSLQVLKVAMNYT